MANDQTPASRIDLHMHTTLSDGKLTPTQLVELLDRRGVSIAAITDHDSIEGLDEAFDVAKGHPRLRLVAGIEISADHPLDEKSDLHMLGYFLEYHDAAFQARLREFRESREMRAMHMVLKLARLGMPVDFERVKEIAGDAGIGRPHIAQAMVERGYIPNVKAAFDGILNDNGSAFVSRPHISMEESVEMIEGVGGVAVLAHPLYVTNYRELLPRLRNMGVAGFEVHYAEFTPEQRAELVRLADKLGMLPCGGSDYHAMGHPGEHLPGSAGPSAEVFAELERRAMANRVRR